MAGCGVDDDAGKDVTVMRSTMRSGREDAGQDVTVRCDKDVMATLAMRT